MKLSDIKPGHPIWDKVWRRSDPASVDHASHLTQLYEAEIQKQELAAALRKLLKCCPLSGDLALMVRLMQGGGEENAKRANDLVEHYQHLDEAQDAARKALIDAGERL